MVEEKTPEILKALQAVHTEKEYHLWQVGLAQEIMKRDIERATNGEFTVLSFDLQKTFSLPKVLIAIVYYKRQLSCFNLGTKGTMKL